MKNTKSTWHYPRKELAEAYIKQLNAGLGSIAIFAERRKGKTEFLLQDLTPAAKELGLRTAYVNFWERKSDPIYCITQGVRRSLEINSPLLLRKWKKEISLKLGAVQAKLSSENNATELASESLDLLLKPKTGILLMFDEIQHLATNPDYEDIIATLRTFLDTNKNKVRAVFTGSSQDRLNRIFRNQRAAFYRSASLVEFPNMGEHFISFLIDKFAYLSNHKIPLKKTMNIFERYNHSPFLIVDLLQIMLREGIYDINKGLEYYLNIADPTEESREIWESLKLIDQLILSEVIYFSRPLYHKDTYKLLSDTLGVNNISRGTVQASIKRLREQGILNNEGRGQWRFESKEFEEYIATECIGKK